MSGYKPLILSETGLVAYWRLGEPSGTSAVDIVAANNGTYTNSPVLGAAGALEDDPDTAVTFAAASSRWVDIPTGSYAFSNGPYSGECWFNMASSGANFTIMQIPAVGAVGAIGIALGPLANGKVSVRDGTTRIVDSGATLYNDGKWHHVVFTKIVASNVWKLYVDAVDVTNAGTAPSTATTTPATNHNTIGSNQGSSQFFTGTIDEVAFYNVALSQAQVLAHYTASRLLTHPSFLPPQLIAQ